MNKVYFCVGEISGDIVAAAIVKHWEGQDISCRAICGPNMTNAKIEKVADYTPINLMGFMEIIPHLYTIYKFFNKIINDILEYNPDVLVTIDSPGFNFRIAKKIGEMRPDIRIVHIVAPTVWAYAPERAKKCADLYDVMVTLLPFEAQYFTPHGLKTVYAGHHIFEQKFCDNKFLLSEKYHLKNDDIAICVTPGSRKGEIARHLFVFLDGIEILQKELKNRKITAFVVSASDVMQEYLVEVSKGHHYTFEIIIVPAKDKYMVYAGAQVAIAKSGTNTLEIAAHKIPMIVGYKMNFFTWEIIRRKINIKYASLINIVSDRMVIPELIQNACTAEAIAELAMELIIDPEVAAKQVSGCQQAIDLMRNSSGTPSEVMAQTIKSLL